MIKVLFVCLGNIIRSQIAETVFKDMVLKDGLEHKIYVDSAGTIGTHAGSYPDPRTISLLEKHGLTDYSKSRKVQQTDFEEFDYILTMDRMNLLDLNEVKPKELLNHPTIRPLRQYSKGSDEEEIRDPYYGTEADFEETYEVIKHALEGFMKYLKKQYQL